MTTQTVFTPTELGWLRAVDDGSPFARPWATPTHAAVAVALGHRLADTREAFPPYREDKTKTPDAVVQALRLLGVEGHALPKTVHVGGIGVSGPPGLVRSPVGTEWPHAGLALVQFRGRWDLMPLLSPQQLGRARWVATRSAVLAMDRATEAYSLTEMSLIAETAEVFDVDLNTWVQRRAWIARTAKSIPHATGSWWLQTAIVLHAPRHGNAT